MVVQILCSHQLLVELWVGDGDVPTGTPFFMPWLEANRYLSWSTDTRALIYWDKTSLCFKIGLSSEISNGDLEINYFLCMSSQSSPNDFPFHVWSTLENNKWDVAWLVSTCIPPRLRLKLCTGGSMPRFVPACHHSTGISVTLGATEYDTKTYQVGSEAQHIPWSSEIAAKYPVKSLLKVIWFPISLFRSWKHPIPTPRHALPHRLPVGIPPPRFSICSPRKTLAPWRWHNDSYIWDVR